MSTSHRINVLGKELQVKSSAPAETVREIESYVNAKISEVAAAVRGGDSQVVAALALMNIAESYLALAKQSSSDRQADQERVHRLLERVGRRLKDN